MSKAVKIDFISDVACPWCVIGLGALEEALARTADAVDAELVFHPFEINPDMPPEGQNLVEHLTEKYGTTPAQSESSRPSLIARAREVGFDMAMSADSRFYNTFDAHRLLHWAQLEGRQHELKNALFTANFTDNRDISDPCVLADVAESVGLDRAQAEDVLASGRYAKFVRRSEELWMSRGINAVPSIVINDTFLISGGQTAEIFEQVLRQIASRS